MIQVIGSALLYVLYLLPIMTALGMLASRLRFQSVNRVSLFLLGAACTPFALACSTLLLLCIPIRLPRLAYILAPLLLAGLVIALCAPKLPKPRLPHAPRWFWLVLVKVATLFPLFVPAENPPKPLLLVACSVAFTVCSLAACRDLWRDAPRKGRLLGFLFYAAQNLIVIGAALYSAGLLEHTPRRGALVLLIGLAAAAACAFGLSRILSRVCRLDRPRAFLYAAYWGVGAGALLLQRFWVQAIADRVKTVNARVMVTALGLLAILFAVCLAVWLAKRAASSMQAAPDSLSLPPKPSLLDTVRGLTKPAVVLFSLLAVLTALAMLISLSIAPVSGSDANEYMTSAYEIAEKRTLDSVNSYNGSPSGSQIGVVHHPAWIAYHAQALMFAPGDALGYPQDVAARVAFAFSHLCMLLAVYALARCFLPPTYALLAVALALCTPNLAYSMYFYSRDCFRITPLLMLILALYGYSGAVSKQKPFYGGGLLCIFALSSFAMMGHVINAIPAAAIGVSFLLLCALQRAFHRGIVYSCLAALLGGVFGCIQIVIGYLEHGKLISEMVSLDAFLAGTPYLDNFHAHQTNRLYGTQTYVERLDLLLRRDHGVLCLAGLAVCIAFLLIAVKRARKRQEQGIETYLSLIGICSALMLTDLFAWSGYTFSEWALMNTRYLLHLYPIFAVVLAGGLYRISRVEWKRAPFALAACALIGLYALYAFVEVANHYPIGGHYAAHTYTANQIADVRIRHADAGKKGRILIDNYTDNYYLNAEALSIFSEPARAIRSADTAETLEKALRDANVDTILITNNFIPVYWHDTVLMDFVASDACGCQQYQDFRVYALLSP